MNDPFYYFFSATPQVLSGLLAVFGAIVIFKVQNIKSELIGFAKSINEEIKSSLKNSNIIEETEYPYLIVELENAINRNDLMTVKVTIDKMTIEFYDYATHCIRFLSVFQFYENLQKKTIKWSKVNAAIIIVCLAIIPFGEILVKNEFLLWIIFLSVIIGLVVCFIQFLLILTQSLKDTISTLYPDHYI